MRYSIILPVHNGGEYVKECVRSILAQDLHDFNLVVLENCSTDGTAEWLESLHDERIVIHNAEKLLTIEENWARILTVSKNEFITLIGHDDILYPWYLSEMDRMIAKHPGASLWQSNFRYIDKDGNLVRPCLPMDEVQKGYEFLAAQMCRTIDSTGTGYMMRSKDFDIAGGLPAHYPNLIFADYHLWVQLSALSYKATALKECFAYRVHDNLSIKTNGEDYLRAFEHYVNFLSKKTDVEGFKEVISRHGGDFLLYFCQALAHRLLKTPTHQRRMHVKDLIADFTEYARLLIPDQEFKPSSKFLIRLAKQLDSNFAGRQIFSLYQRIK